MELLHVACADDQKHKNSSGYLREDGQFEDKNDYSTWIQSFSAR
jgi:hypothetical protein